MKACVSSVLVSLLLSGALAAPLTNEARLTVADDLIVPADTSASSLSQIKPNRRATEMPEKYGPHHQARAYVPPAQLEADRRAYEKKIQIEERAEAYISQVQDEADDYALEKRVIDFDKRELMQTIEDNFKTVVEEHKLSPDLENRLKEAVKQQLKDKVVRSLGKRDITSDLKGVADDFIKIFGSEAAFAPILAQFKKQLDESIKNIKPPTKTTTAPPKPAASTSQQQAKPTPVTTITQQVKENAAPTTTPPPGLTPEEIEDAKLQSSIDAVARSMIAEAEKKEADEAAKKAADKKKKDEEAKKKKDEEDKKKKDEEAKKKKEEEDKKKAQVKVKDEKPAYNY